MIRVPRYRRDVSTQADVEAACRAASEYAEMCGMASHAAGEVRLICSELATNMLKHATDGRLDVATVSDGPCCGVRIEATDSGPGIRDIALAMTEGYTTAGGLGQGLPLARRLSNTFELESNASGTRVVATRWS